MSRVFFIRHGLAGERDPMGTDAEDCLRPLTRKGQKKFQMMRDLFRRTNAEPDLIATSPLIRALQTAEILRKPWKDAPFEVWPELCPNYSPQELALALSRRLNPSETLFLVGHEPQLSLTVEIFLNTAKDRILNLKKGSILGIEFDGKPLETRARLQFHLCSSYFD